MRRRDVVIMEYGLWRWEREGRLEGERQKAGWAVLVGDDRITANEA